MTIYYVKEYRRTAPLRLLRRDPDDYTRLVVHNERHGMVDDGDCTKEAPEHCYNCDTPNSLYSSVSLHFCKCGLIFNYWAGGGNEKWHRHYKLMDEARSRQASMDWYEADDYV